VACKIGPHLMLISPKRVSAFPTHSLKLHQAPSKRENYTKRKAYKTK
jgi:hypothetical protein